MTCQDYSDETLRFLIVHDTSTGNQIKRISSPGHLAIIQALFFPDGERLATCSMHQDRTWRLELWKWRSGERLNELVLPGLPQFTAQRGLIANRSGTRLVVACEEGGVLVLDTTTAELRLVRKWTGSAVRWYQLSPDGQWLAGTSSTAGVLWNIETGQTRTIAPQEQELRYCHFSPDGQLLVTASDNATVKIWNVLTSAPVGKPLTHPSSVHFVEFSPDGRHLLTVCRDTSARVWDVSEQRTVAAPITAPEDLAACFRASGRQLVVADYEGRLEAWDWRRRQRLMPSCQVFRDHAFFWDGTRTMVLSPDERYVALGGLNALHLIPLDALDATNRPPAEELVMGAEILSHLRLQNGSMANLTSEEWYQRWQQLRSRSKTPRHSFSFEAQ